MRLQESGVVVPSTTILAGRLAIRAAVVNHRTSQAEIDDLVEATLSIGRELQPKPIAMEKDVSIQSSWEPRLAQLFYRRVAPCG